MVLRLRNRTRRTSIALETTLLTHGVPRDGAIELAFELAGIVKEAGAAPAYVGVVRGEPIVGMSDAELAELIGADDVVKVNTSNLGVAMHRKQMASTTVSATMELAHEAGVRVMATGGIGGVHTGAAMDISADLAAMARSPVAVVSSGVKSILDATATREALESLGVPVVGFNTNRFAAFYRREADADVDAMYTDVNELAQFLLLELPRSHRGVLVVNPIPRQDELDAAELEGWMREAAQRARSQGATGRDVTPRTLAALHEISHGATLSANLALVRSNVRFAAELRCAMLRQGDESSD